MNEVVVLMLWSASIAGVVEGIKAGAGALGRLDNPYFQRALPVMPFILGALTGAFVLPRVAAQAGFEILAEAGAPTWAFVGFGAGAVAGQCFKFVRQSIKGRV